MGDGGTRASTRELARADLRVGMGALASGGARPAPGGTISTICGRLLLQLQPRQEDRAARADERHDDDDGGGGGERGDGGGGERDGDHEEAEPNPGAQ